MKKWNAVVFLLLVAALVFLVAKRMEANSSPEGTGFPVPALETQAALSQHEDESLQHDLTDTADKKDEIQEQQLTLRADEVLSGMSLHEKVCQMMIVYPDAVSGVEGTTIAGRITLDGLVEYPVGGLVFHAKNLVSKEQASAFIKTVQENSEIDLFMCADEEGGRVARLMGDENIGTTRLEPMYSYRMQGNETAYSNALTIAGDMAALGFNLDLAPVADVWSNPENTVIGDRAYSDSFSQAAELIPQAVRGFHDGGVLCALKHFPGHGDTLEDTHYQSAVVSRSREELAESELLPFAAGISAGADMVMIGHMTVLAYDSCPATLSSNVIQGLLRDAMGFDGVVISDSLKMDAIREYYSDEQVSILAVKAGNNILLGPDSLQNTVSTIEAAVADGSLSEEFINDSVRRILYLKLRAGIIE